MQFNETNYGDVTKIPHNLIYFLIYKNEVVYVGQTIKGYSRIYEHTDKVFDSAYYIEVDEADLDKMEGYYIIKYDPKYNKRLNKSYVNYNNLTHYINLYIADLYKGLGLKYKYCNTKILHTIFELENYKIYNYFGISYIYIDVLYNIEAKIHDFLKGAPINEIYDFRV